MGKAKRNLMIKDVENPQLIKEFIKEKTNFPEKIEISTNNVVIKTTLEELKFTTSKGGYGTPRVATLTCGNTEITLLERYAYNKLVRICEKVYVSNSRAEKKTIVEFT